MTEYEKQYIAKFDELNVLSATFSNVDMENENAKEDAREHFSDILIEAYLLGWNGAEYMLGEETKVPTDKEIEKFVNIRYPDGQTPEDKFNEYMESGDNEAMLKVLETEYHRGVNQGAEDRAQSSPNKKNITKTWLTMRDNRVREEHSYLEGVTIPIDGEFETHDGYKTKAPGLFGVPQLDVNRRCILRYNK